MPVDYPDFMTHVERTPIQKLEHQIFGVKSWENQPIDPEREILLNWNIPDNSYYYCIDSVFIIIDTLYPLTAVIDICNDQNNPSWISVLVSKGNGNLDLVVSRQGAFSLAYPAAIRFRVLNYRRKTAYTSVYCNYFRYPKEG